MLNCAVSFQAIKMALLRILISTARMLSLVYPTKYILVYLGFQNCYSDFAVVTCHMTSKPTGKLE